MCINYKHCFARTEEILQLPMPRRLRPEHVILIHVEIQKQEKFKYRSLWTKGKSSMSASSKDI